MTNSSIFWLSYAALWMLTLLLGFSLILLLRDLAKRRLVSRDARKLQGLPLDKTWAGLTVPTVGGVVQLPEAGVGQIIVVGSKRCALCRQAMLALGDLAAEIESSHQYFFVYPGTREEMRLHIGDPSTGVTVIYDVKNVVRRQLGIVAVPYAAAVDDVGRVRDAKIAYTRPDLEGLLNTLGIRQEAIAVSG